MWTIAFVAALDSAIDAFTAAGFCMMGLFIGVKAAAGFCMTGFFIGVRAAGFFIIGGFFEMGIAATTRQEPTTTKLEFVLALIMTSREIPRTLSYYVLHRLTRNAQVAAVQELLF